MNKKSYFRGLSVGMVVAAIIMGVVSNTTRMSDAEILRRAQEIQNKESVTLSQLNENTSSVSDEKTPGISNEKTPDVSNDGGSDKAGGNKPETNDINESVSNESNSSVDKSDGVNTEGSNIEGAGSSTEGENSSTEGVNSSVGDADSNSNGLSGESGTLGEPEKINPMPEGETGFVSSQDVVTITIVRGDSSVSVARRMYDAGLVESAAEFDKYLCSNGYDKSISVGVYEIEYGLEFDEMARIISRRR